MKKLVMSICLILLMVMLFMSGCQEKAGDDGVENLYDKMFIGEWLNNESSSYNERWTFYDNGTLKIIVSWDAEEEPIITSYWFLYRANEDELYLSSIDETPESPSYYLECHSYKFSKDMNHLTLGINGFDFMEFIKIPRTVL